MILNSIIINEMNLLKSVSYWFLGIKFIYAVKIVDDTYPIFAYVCAAEPNGRASVR
jgi:hypothetical protein